MLSPARIEPSTVIVPTANSTEQVTKPSLNLPLTSPVFASFALSASPELLILSSSFISEPITVPTTRQITVISVFVIPAQFWIPIAMVISPIAVMIPLVNFSGILFPQSVPKVPPRIIRIALITVAII